VTGLSRGQSPPDQRQVANVSICAQELVAELNHGLAVDLSVGSGNRGTLPNRLVSLISSRVVAEEEVYGCIFDLGVCGQEPSPTARPGSCCHCLNGVETFPQSGQRTGR
jgi:hypothetical protein